jgi:23S rRNA (guanine745-N1)-methyltransferase
LVEYLKRSGLEGAFVLRDAVDFLICPHCGADFALEPRSVRCRRGHTFDIARQGYVNLLTGAPAAGDTHSMVAAREAFLGAGHFSSLRDRVVAVAEQITAECAAGCIVDIGSGTGYYLGGTLDRLPDRVGLALDISKYAARRAAHAHPRAGAAVCDVWRSLPVRGGAAGLVLNVFAPRNGAEFRRVLDRDGALVVVVPTRRHLEEIVDALGLLTVDENKDERIHEQLGSDFDHEASAVHEFLMTLDHEYLAALIQMGPSAWHVEGSAIEERIKDLPSAVAVTASVVVSVYRPV